MQIFSQLFSLKPATRLRLNIVLYLLSKSELMNSNKSFASTNYELAYYEAQTFLTVAEEIRKKAQSILLSGIAEQSQGINTNNIEKSIGLQYAEHVNHAFAVELLLKCIMIMEDGQYYLGHDLFALFDKLRPLTQLTISARFDEYRVHRRNRVYFGFMESVTILDVLNEAQEAFKDFRYLFEQKERPSYDLSTVVECLEYYIKQQKPDLKF